MFSAIAGVGAAIVALAALGGLAALLAGLAGVVSTSDGEPAFAGGTLEWASTSGTGVDGGGVSMIESPYPLLDRDEKGAE